MTTSLEFRVTSLETEAVRTSHKIKSVEDKLDYLSSDVRELRHDMREQFAEIKAVQDAHGKKLDQILALLQARK